MEGDNRCAVSVIFQGQKSEFIDLK